MRRRSQIYEEIVAFLRQQNMLDLSFLASEIIIPNNVYFIKNFIYKHSNPNYGDRFTLFFNRESNTRPIQFRVNDEIMQQYFQTFQKN